MNGVNNGAAIRAWFNLVLNFLLGLFYFIFLMTGFPIGFGLLVLIVGIPIIRFMLNASRELALFDRQLGARLLQADVPRNYFSGPGSVLYLFAKFPIGILSLVWAVLLTPLALLALFLDSETEAGMLAGQLLTRLSGATSGLTSASAEEADTAESALEKPKRGAKAKRLATPEEESDMEYYLGADGEIESRRK
jgi:hypothetical protein